MRAAVFHGAYDVRVEEVAAPDPEALAPDEALVRVEKAAICGTDLHPYEGRMDMEDGVVLGHEFLGTVVAAGAAVTGFSAEDRAVASCCATCGSCYFCRRGEPGRCAGTRMFGMGMALGDLPGSQCEYVVVPWADRTLRAIPVGAPDEDVLLAGDIMTTAFESVRRALRPGDTVAIVGAGPVGQCAVMAAHALGAGQVLAIDRVPARLSLAREQGAVAIDARDSDPADAVFDLTDWRGADVVIDAVGHPDALATACSIVRAGGTISIPGAYLEESLALPFGDLWLKGVSIHMGVTHFHNHIDEVLSLIVRGRLRPSAVISHRLALTQADSAYELFHEREALKIVLDPGS